MNPSAARASLQLLPLDFAAKHAFELSESARRVAGDWIPGAIKRFERVFILRSAIAPGLAFVGAQASAYPFSATTPSPIRLSAGGTGLSLVDALIACMGEGLEFLSQVEREGDVTHRDTMAGTRDLLAPDIASWLAEYLDGAACGRPVDWMMATNVDGRCTTLIPADLCLRRSDSNRVLPLRGPLSTGCAVGPSREEAALRAILELVERDAVALWWLGGCPGRPVSPGGTIAAEAADLLHGLRDGQDGRMAWLLDITTDLGVPTFAALSAATDGHQLACGFAARTVASDAARAAILEMAQVETAFALIEAKLSEGGPSALDEIDHRHLRRGALNVRACRLLHPVSLPAPWPQGEPQGSTPLEGLIQRLRDHGVGIWLTSLTRAEHGVDAIRALAPVLQPFPSTYRSRRLLSTVAICGGSNQYAEGVDIM